MVKPFWCSSMQGTGKPESLADGSGCCDLGCSCALVAWQFCVSLHRRLAMKVIPLLIIWLVNTYINHIYPLVMTNIANWKISMLLRTVNHLFLWNIYTMAMRVYIGLASWLIFLGDFWSTRILESVHFLGVSHHKWVIIPLTIHLLSMGFSSKYEAMKVIPCLVKKEGLILPNLTRIVTTHSRETFQPTSIMRWDRGIFSGTSVYLGGAVSVTNGHVTIVLGLTS